MSGSSLICHQPPPQSILCRLVMVIWRPKTSWFPPLDGCIWLILPPSSQLTSNMYVWHVPGDPVMFWSEADKFHFCMFVVYLYDLMFFCFSFYRFFFVSDCSSECLCESFFFLFRPGQSCRFQFLFWHHWAASLLFIMVFVLSLQNSLTVRTMCATRFESSVGNRCVNFLALKRNGKKFAWGAATGPVLIIISRSRILCTPKTSMFAPCSWALLWSQRGNPGLWSPCDRKDGFVRSRCVSFQKMPGNLMHAFAFWWIFIIIFPASPIPFIIMPVLFQISNFWKLIIIFKGSFPSRYLLSNRDYFFSQDASA